MPTKKEIAHMTKNHHLDFVRVDYENGLYEYLPNDELVWYECSFNKVTPIWRNSELMKHNYKYIRIKRMSKIPKDKQLNKLYGRKAETSEKGI